MVITSYLLNDRKFTPVVRPKHFHELAIDELTKNESDKHRRQILINVYGFFWKSKTPNTVLQFKDTTELQIQSRFSPSDAFKYLVMAALLKVCCFLFPSFYAFLSASKSGQLTNKTGVREWILNFGEKSVGFMADFDVRNK